MTAVHGVSNQQTVIFARIAAEDAAACVVAAAVGQKPFPPEGTAVVLTGGLVIKKTHDGSLGGGYLTDVKPKPNGQNCRETKRTFFQFA